MAPIGERSNANAGNMENAEDESQNLWTSILGEVSTHSTSKLPSCKSILVLGDDESGKTTLIARLQHAEDPKKGHALEYHYLNVRDEDRDDTARCGVWILAGDEDHYDLLKFSLTPDNFEHTMGVIVIDMAEPWTIMENLNKWTEVLRRHIDTLRLHPEKMQDLEQKLVRQFQEYQEPEEGDDAKSPRRTTTSNPSGPGGAGSEEDKVLLPLGDTTLTHNLGIPLVVVITKSDAISSLEKDHDFKDEQLDFIQQHVRKFCLNYGAALFYVSVKENKNCDLLHKYLLHRIYEFPFSSPALVVEKDALFVPSGWDNLQKISILYENMPNINPDQPYEDVIHKPIIRKPLQDSKEINAEDEQVFLAKQQTLLSKSITPGKGAQDPNRGMRTPEKGGRIPSISNISPINKTGQVKMEAGKPGSTNEGVLANFFNSLLSKKTAGSPGSPGTPASPQKGDKTVRSDAAAELDRMNRTRRPVPGVSPTTNNAS
ncbi:cytoplasmic dynein 1 light intermediate chain 2-like isoform X2 [Amphiura filiformis]|uniref:cytoplasmic dynein 1 light intermediate chain 2-like isoform X2 n=1 Tax=Amphiura filiformis TaxID=82378 RepID=UPI003B220BC2